MQAASAIETLKMTDSPAKKLSFASEDKENVYKPIVGIPDLDDEEDASAGAQKVAVAPTIKADEAHEPLLQENAQRFVLFPIKYHDVR
jgi:ribonucleoside-diphosphate reductase subunit M2